MPNWTVEDRDGVALLTYTRPPRNYLDFASIAELGDRLEELAERSGEVKVVMLTGGVDGYFIAHGDLEDLARLGRGEGQDGPPAWRRVTDLVRDLPQPVVAAIDGQAWGAGNELAIACQLRVASERSHLGNPEVNVGITTGGGGTPRLLRLIGPGLAADVLLRGRLFGAAEALRVGWVNEVLPNEGFVDAAVEWCRKLVELPTNAVYAAKRVLVQSAELSLDEGLALELDEFRNITGNSPEMLARIDQILAGH
ncbi:enoyl-CoA hydratase/isomerase family protein [Amycolatopsis carbonis]|uniref:Enoyl-CoA hydratase/isomerase family protein n=1 Tax=Amycolatopsis carbonis TaxID=715471 RepID=A0A9Y2MW31_9PSEU|nr:enoyl-CoA hydratase/isomerase family protein [Amycolatopsis sp. 2-15]WIX77367.1 enoyl-CoA hydratase/isomerase family protein [Amycolatopsis sp. 2-15]